MMKAWYVGTTKEQQELRAAAELRAQGYGVYLPKRHERVQEGRKVWARSFIRFTGYIFIAFDFALDEHGPIRNTRGMDSPDGEASPLIVDGQRKPLALPAGIIETLRGIEDEELARSLARKKPVPRLDLTPGDKVTIFGDRDHPAFGRKGEYLGTENFVAHVLEGWAIWKVPEIDLRKIETEGKQAA